MTSEVVLLDANVLYPAPLRDLLLQLSFTGVYQAHWSADIEVEWKRNLLAARPELAERIERTRGGDATRSAGRAHHRLRPSDPHADPSSIVTDRHVLAAAIVASAEVIVTFNGRDFPDLALAPHGVIGSASRCFLARLGDRNAVRSAGECACVSCWPRAAAGHGDRLPSHLAPPRSGRSGCFSVRPSELLGAVSPAGHGDGLPNHLAPPRSGRGGCFSVRSSELLGAVN